VVQSIDRARGDQEGDAAPKASGLALEGAFHEPITL
jgi:hypothetical protein